MADKGAPSSAQAPAAPRDRIQPAKNTHVNLGLVPIQNYRLAYVTLLWAKIAQIGIAEHGKSDHDCQHKQEFYQSKHPKHPFASVPRLGETPHFAVLVPNITGLLPKITPFRKPQRILAEAAAVLPFLLKKSVAMVGMMGAGKSAIGTALARHLEVPFLDSDAEIETAANMSVAEIFERDGEPFFREKEAQVIQRLLDGNPCILSTGGGAYLRPENREAITENGVAVWLRADLDLLWNRVKHKNTRPLLHTPNPRNTLAELARLREPEYAKADIVVDADPGFSIDEMTAKVLEALLMRPDILEQSR